MCDLNEYQQENGTLLIKFHNELDFHWVAESLAHFQVIRPWEMTLMYWSCQSSFSITYFPRTFWTLLMCFVYIYLELTPPVGRASFSHVGRA